MMRAIRNCSLLYPYETLAFAVLVVFFIGVNLIFGIQLLFEDKMTKPIKPSDVDANKPPQVLEAFNELIAQNWDGHQANVKSTDVAQKISMLMGISVSEVYEKRYLDIEEVYGNAGWQVVYDKPDYNGVEYDPYFIFSEKPNWPQNKSGMK